MMVVRCIESPQRQHVGEKFVLKIVDPRFCLSQYRTNTSVHALQRLVDMMNCGTAEEFSKTLIADPDKTFPPDRWIRRLSNWQKLVALSLHGYAMARTEATVYKHLQDLQGYHIPTFYYEVCTRPWIKAPPSAAGLVRSCGFLIEYVEGDTLNSFKPSKHESEMQIYEEAIRAFNVFEFYGFEHGSMAKRNTLVRKQPKDDGSRIVCIDFYRHYIHKAEDGYGKYWTHPPHWPPETTLAYDVLGCYSDDGEWRRLLYTGRMNEREVFSTCYNDLVTDAGAVMAAKIRYRVMMDEVWYIDHRPVLDMHLKHKVLLSRVVYKIVQQEVWVAPEARVDGKTWARDDWEKWHLRALPQIALWLGYESEGLLERFECALREYINRPNTPVSVKKAFTDLNPSEDDVHLKSSGSGTGNEEDSSSSSTSGSLFSAAVTPASSRTSFDSLESKPDLRVLGLTGRVFIPKENKWADQDALEEELKAWLSQQD